MKIFIWASSTKSVLLSKYLALLTTYLWFHAIWGKCGNHNKIHWTFIFSLKFLKLLIFVLFDIPVQKNWRKKLKIAVNRSKIHLKFQYCIFWSPITPLQKMVHVTWKLKYIWIGILMVFILCSDQFNYFEVDIFIF